jgi:hypothetical protein
MTQFKNGDRVRVNEGELEGLEGFVMVTGPHVTSVKFNLMSGEVAIPIYTEMLDDAKEPHAALAHLKSLYPDFLRAPKSDNYRFRLTTYVFGITYISAPVTAEVLVQSLGHAPAGLEKVEFMLKQNDPSRGLSWKLLWSD